MSITVSAAYTRTVVIGAERAGADISDLVTPELRRQIEDPDERVDREIVNRLWEAAARRSGDPDLGLHLAEKLQPGAFAVMDYASRNAPELRQAVLRFVRYCRLIHDAARVYLTEEGPVARLGFTLPGLSTPNRQGAEFMVAVWLCAARQMTARHLVPRLVRFEHAPPAQTAEHRRVFGCEVRFGEPTNEVELDSGLLALPVHRADQQLGVLLDRYADELLSRLPRTEGIVDRVRHALTEALRGGDPSVECIAARLGLSPRSLQRRLQEAGTTHKQLLDQLRQELALRYLRTEDLSLGEVAFLLGFSEPSAFNRAFKRWTGSTPGDHRRKQRG